MFHDGKCKGGQTLDTLTIMISIHGSDDNC